MLDCDSAGTRQHLVQLGRPRPGDVLAAVEVRFFLRDVVARAKCAGRMAAAETEAKVEAEAEAEAGAESRRLGRSLRRRAMPKDKGQVVPAAQDRITSEPDEQDKDSAKDKDKEKKKENDEEKEKEKYVVRVAWCGRTVSVAKSVLSLPASASADTAEGRSVGRAPALAQTQWTSYSARLPAPEQSGTHTLDVQVSNVPRLLPPAPSPSLPVPAAAAAAAPAPVPEDKEEDELSDDARRLLALLPERYQVFVQLQG